MIPLLFVVGAATFLSGGVGFPPRSIPLYPDFDTHQAEEACCLAFAPQGERVVFGAADGAVRLDGKAGRLLYRHAHPVTALALTSDGRWLASCASDPLDPGAVGEVKVWDVRRGRHVLAIARRATGVAFSPDGGRLATASVDGIEVWETATGKALMQVGRSPSQVVGFSPDGKLLAAAGDDGLVQLYDTTRGREVRRLPHRGLLRSVAFSPDGRYLASADSPCLRRGGHVVGRLFLVRLDTKEVIEQEGKVKVWELATGQELCTIPGGADEIGAATFSPSGCLLSFGSADAVVVWDIPQCRALARLKAHKSWVSEAAFSPDGKRLASAGADGVRVWDLARQDVAERLRRQKLDDRELQRLTSDLGGDDASSAQRALWALVASPQQSVPALSRCLRPVSPVASDHLTRLVAGLDSNNFRERQKAAEELEALAERAEPALLQVLANNPSLEVRRSVEALLARVARRVLSPEELSGLRGVEVLERIATPQAKGVLERVAGGASEARLTQAAMGALNRLTR